MIRVTKLFFAVMLCCAMLILPKTASTHCQVPCGIYDDNARVAGMLEDVATIRKAVKMLFELADKTDVQSRQQFVRWVTTKEDHAQKIISTISNYFLTQRVKAKQTDYVERLTRHHAVIVNAMQAKQKADQKVVMVLEESVKTLLQYYPEHN